MGKRYCKYQARCGNRIKLGYCDQCKENEIDPRCRDNYAPMVREDI